MKVEITEIYSLKLKPWSFLAADPAQDLVVLDFLSLDTKTSAMLQMLHERGERTNIHPLAPACLLFDKRGSKLPLPLPLSTDSSSLGNKPGNPKEPDLVCSCVPVASERPFFNRFDLPPTADFTTEFLDCVTAFPLAFDCRG